MKLIQVIKQKNAKRLKLPVNFHFDISDNVSCDDTNISPRKSLAGHKWRKVLKKNKKKPCNWNDNNQILVIKS